MICYNLLLIGQFWDRSNFELTDVVVKEYIVNAIRQLLNYSIQYATPDKEDYINEQTGIAINYVQSSAMLLMKLYHTQ